MNRKSAYLIGAAGGALVLGSAANAEAVTYRYDALGRLVAVTRSWGTSGQNVRICYDRAGNRTTYTAADGATPPPPCPPPPQGPSGYRLASDRADV